MSNTIKYFIQHEYQDYAVYRYRQEMDHLPDESEPLDTGIFTEVDGYLEIFEKDFNETTLGLYLWARHGNIISLKIVKGQW